MAGTKKNPKPTECQFSTLFAALAPDWGYQKPKQRDSKWKYVEQKMHFPWWWPGNIDFRDPYETI